ncbi:MAG: PQQ-dependent sugar dehydrogenase, partial [Duganella sp.]
HLGTLVRLDREGRAPADNPFVGQPGAAPEIYSLGHRNAQGVALDPATGALLITEHGARGGDELNRIVAGGNYGWPVVTAGIDYPFASITPFRHLPGYRDPDLVWTPSIAPAGLAIYDGALFADWRGDLLVPALRERAVRRVLRDGQRIVGQQLLLAELNLRIRDVKVAPDGAIYVLTDGVDGKLLRLTPSHGKP